MVDKHKVINRKTLHDGHLKLDEIEIEFDGFDGGKVKATREVVVRKEAAVVLMYEKDTDTVIFVKQFRVPAIEHEQDWLVEVPAGVIDEGEDAESTAIREMMEETGYNIKKLQPIKTFFVSPGYSTERMHLFYTEVTSDQKVSAQEGLIEEGEDIKLVKILVGDLNAMNFQDAKTIIAVQWFLSSQRF